MALSGHSGKSLYVRSEEQSGLGPEGPGQVANQLANYYKTIRGRVPD